MKKRPARLWVVAVVLMVSPVLYYLDAGWRHHIALGEFGRIWATIPLAKLLGILAAPVVGTMVLWVRPFSWYAVLVFAVYTIGVNAATAAPAWSWLLVLLVGLGCIVFFVRREIRSPYFSPRLRWWEPNPRMPVVLRVDVKGGNTLSCSTYDLSSTGVFLVADNPAPVGTRLELGLHLGARLIQVAGTVMWISDGHKLPRGMGLRFAGSSDAIAGLMKGLHAREPRVRAPLKVVFAARPESRAETVNLSTKGVFVATRERFAMDERVAFTIEWQATAIPVRGTIVWMALDGPPPGVGIEFDECPPALQAAVRSLRRTGQAADPTGT